MILFFFFFFVRWIFDDYSYPKGLIVAFKLKPFSKEGPTEQNSIHLEEENVGGNKTERSNSTGNVTLESEQNATGNDNDGVEKALDVVKMEGVKNLAKDHLDGNKEKPAEDATQESDDKVTEDPAPENEEKATVAEEIVTREDLKLAFQKFGTVKVMCDQVIHDEFAFLLICLLLIVALGSTHSKMNWQSMVATLS